MTITLVLAEDSFLMREGISALLALDGELELLAGCASYDELMTAVEEHHPQVVITDIRMPPTQTDEGIRAANAIRANHPDTGVVVLSQYVEPAYALKLFEQGSDGRAYLLKERVADLGELGAAIRRVARTLRRRLPGGAGGTEWCPTGSPLHHAPGRTDAEISDIERALSARSPVVVEAAREGTTIEL